jgi:predicted acyl esterase
VGGTFSPIEHDVPSSPLWRQLAIAQRLRRVHRSILSKMAQSSSWKDLAEKKRNAIYNSIPAKWQIEKSKLQSNEEQRDVTGYIQQFLSKREVEITETDVVGIAKETSSGNWTAAEVTEAFCHRASLAHQLVSDNWLRSTTLVSYFSCTCEAVCSCNGM